MLPPSVRANGKWEWIKPIDVPLQDLPEPPEWLIQKLSAADTNTKSDIRQAGQSIPVGSRNTSLFNTTLNLNGQGYTFSETLVSGF